MHTQPKPLVSRHRRARLLAWTLALLVWLGRALGGEPMTSPRHRRRAWFLFDLDRIAARAAKLIVLRAFDLMQARRRRRVAIYRHGRDIRPSGFLRSIIGSRLRRALKHRDIAARIAILIDALQRIDAWAADFARRGRCRISKLWPIPPAPGAAVPLAAGATPTPAAADTS